jgi:outer membrane protein
MKSVFLLLVFIFSSAIAFAQSPDVSQPWNLQQCIEYAITHNIQVKQSELNLELQKDQYTQSKGNILPSINANASHTLNAGRRIDPFTNTFANNTVVSDNFSISGSLTLFSGFQNYNTILQNNYNIIAGKYDVDKMRNDISLNVATVYLQILFNKELVTNAQAQVDITKQQVERIKKQVDAGVLAKGSLYDIQAQLASEELNMVNAQNQLDISYLTLSQLLEINAPIEIVKPDLNVPQNINMNLNPIQIFNTAVTLMPEIKSNEYKILSAQKGLKISYSGLYPSLTVSGSYGTGFSGASKDILSITPTGSFDTTGITTGGDYVVVPTFDYKTQTTPFSKQLDQNLNKSIGVFLTVPLFNRFQNKTNISRSRINVLNAQLSLDLAKNQLQKSVQQAYADAFAALNKYNATLKTVSAMEESFKYTEQRYNVNMISTFNYNDAKNKLNKTKSDLLQAKFDYIFKMKILDFYMGKPLTL